VNALHDFLAKLALEQVMEALMIGVSGTRGTIGGTLTPLVVGQMAAAFAVWLNESIETTGFAVNPADAKIPIPLRVVIGRDSRPSGPWVRDAAIAALVASGIEVIDLDIVTTPGVAMMVKHLNADAGMVITASHNPIEWNGLKFLTRDCVAPPPRQAERIKQLYNESRSNFVRVEHLRPTKKNPETHALHIKRILDRVDVLGISSKRFKVVLDSVNGAGCVATATMLNKLGCQLIHIHGTPNGQFPHEPEPTEKNLVGLCDEVKRQKASIGFAQDPDADRLAIVDENGKYIGEEYSLALAAKFILGKKPGIAVTNLSTSRMIDDIAAATDSRVLRTAVGEANVIDTMLREKAFIGGEGNGGVIDPRIVPGRDSLVGIAYVLQLLAEAGKPLSQLIAEMPRYEIVKTKFECRREDANRAVVAVVSELSTQPGVTIDTQDGIRIDWLNERAWVHARPSNTEPIMRIIAEAPDQSVAQSKIDQVQTIVNRVLST
jgi:phosphomannomutase